MANDIVPKSVTRAREAFQALKEVLNEVDELQEPTELFTDRAGLMVHYRQGNECFPATVMAMDQAYRQARVMVLLPIHGQVSDEIQEHAHDSDARFICVDNCDRDQKACHDSRAKDGTWHFADSNEMRSAINEARQYGQIQGGYSGSL